MSHLSKRRQVSQLPGRIDPREVPPSRHTIFIRNIPHNIGIEKVRNFFCDETDSDVTVDFYGTSEDKRYHFVALRFESHAFAREIKEKYNNQRLFGNTVTISWFKNLKKERDKRIAMGIMPPLPVRDNGHYSFRGSGGGYYREGGGRSSSRHRTPRHRRDDSHSKRYTDDIGGREDDRASSRSRHRSRDHRYSSDSYSEARSRSRSHHSNSMPGSSGHNARSHGERSRSRRSRSRASSQPPKKRSRRVSTDGIRSSKSRSRTSRNDSHSREIRRKGFHRMGDTSDVVPEGSDREMSPSVYQNEVIHTNLQNAVTTCPPVTTPATNINVSQANYASTEETWSALLDNVAEQAVSRIATADTCSSQEAVRKKKNEIETSYKKDCETFSVVAKLLINKDRDIEDRVLHCLKEVLHDLGQQCIQDLRTFINAAMEKAEKA